MTFGEAVRSCLRNYATVSGRAPRSEYWWFALFLGIVQLVGAIPVLGEWLVWLVTLASVLPWISVAVRRLHDLNLSGWYLLLIVPLVGLVVLGLVMSAASESLAVALLWIALQFAAVICMWAWALFKGTSGPNRFGPDPLADAAAAPIPDSGAISA